MRLPKKSTLLPYFGFTIKPELFIKYFKQFGVMVNPLKGFTINSRTSNRNYRSGDVMDKSLMGFTIIEFLIVITILSITGTLVTTSYLSFERRQKIKNSALEVKSQLRLAQNNALTGNKGVRGLPAESCADTNKKLVDDPNKLVGWYALIDTADSSITSAGVCLSPTGESKFLESEKFLDESVIISDMYLDTTLITNTNVLILFQPIRSGVHFYEVDKNNDPPIVESSFLDPSGEIIQNDTLGGNIVRIRIEGADDPSGTAYDIEIKSSGEISENKL